MINQTQTRFLQRESQVEKENYSSNNYLVSKQNKRAPDKESGSTLEKVTLILYTRYAGKKFVTRVSPRASQFGITINMPIEVALCLCPQAKAHELNSVEDYLALERLARRATKLSPIAAIDRELALAYQEVLKTGDPCHLNELSEKYTGIVVDLTGTARLHKSEEKLAERLKRYFERIQVDFKLAIAPSVGAAWALSRYGKGKIIHLNDFSKESRKLVDELPHDSLRIPERVSESLKQMGLYLIGDLLKLPMRTLGERFGYILSKRIDQLLGAIPEQLDPIKVIPPLSRNLNFDSPLQSRQIVQKFMAKILHELYDALRIEQKYLRTFSFTIGYYGKRLEKLLIEREISVNTRDDNFSHLAEILKTSLEGLSFSYAPESSCSESAGVYSISITVKNTSPSLKLQHDFIRGTEILNLHEESCRLIDNLMVKLNSKHISTLMFKQSHIPEQSFKYRALNSQTFNSLEVLSVIENETARRSNSDLMVSDWRPSYMLQIPVRIKAIALLPDRPPSSITHNGKNMRIVHGFGPERINSEWWKEYSNKNEQHRDYFCIQSEDGLWFWVFRNNNKSYWYLHGMWC